MLFQGKVASAIASSRTSGQPNAQQLWLGELAVSEVMPRYSAVSKSGKMFYASGALQTLSASGTAMTGLVLWNSSSGSSAVDLHVTKVAGNVAVTSATLTTIWLGRNAQASAPTSTTAAVQTAGYIGSSTGSGLAYTVATVAAAPTAILPLLHNTAAINTVGEDPGFYLDLEGSVIVPPGYAVSFFGNAASAATAVNLSIAWAELPV